MGAIKISLKLVMIVALLLHLCKTSTCFHADANHQASIDMPDILVLVCTQSFTGEELVETLLWDHLLDAGWSVRVSLVDEAGIDWMESSSQQEQLNLSDHARVVLVVASTYAEGDPPNHAAEFANWLVRPLSSSDGETAMPPFALFALGDSSYAHYCAFGEFVDTALQDKGARQLLPVHYGDVLADQSGAFQTWCDQVIVALSNLLGRRVNTAGAQQRLPFSSTGSDWRRSAVQSDSLVANLTETRELLHDSLRSVVHVNLSMPTTGLVVSLQPGDQVGVYPLNSQQIVQRALAWLGIDTDMPTKILERRQEIWVEQSITAGEFLTAHVDLEGRATPSALRTLLPFVGTLELRALARDLTFIYTKSSTTNSTTAHESSTLSAFENWVAGRRLTKLDLAELFECRPSLQAFARAIGPMQPRLYSVATVHLSPEADEQTIGLCISVVEGGLCSNYVANLDPGNHVTLFLRKSQFHFIPDGSPALLIAAGSGIGPYMGFFGQQSEQMTAPNATAPLSHVRLYFGCRTPSEILYKERLYEFEHLGSVVRYAFSRLFGHPKLHVQDLLTREMPVVWKEVFENRGRIFVCGRLEICNEVKGALVEVARVEGGLQQDAAHKAVEDMEKEGRLLTDCWSVDSAPLQPKMIRMEKSPHRVELHHGQEKTLQIPPDPSEDLSKVPTWPSYLRLVASGEFERRIENATSMFSACVACGRFCEVNRLSSNPEDWGECRVGNRAIVSAVDAHFGEEDCLKGTHGSGTIFFGSCNLKCMYCQNWQISMKDRGELVDDNRLAEMMLSLQQQGCHNINLVSPTHNVLPILRAVLIAAKSGLKLPIVWNTGGYDSVASLRLLEDIVDIYLPDSKYASRSVARKLSRVDNYPEINQAAIKEMHRQVGELQIDPRTGLAWRGVLVRHLVLPSDLAGTTDVASFLANEVGVNTYTHVMDYYRPEYEARGDKKYGLYRKPSQKELQYAHEGARSASLWRLHGEMQSGSCPSPEKCRDSDRNEEQCPCKSEPNNI